MKTALWEDDELQFARLLCEIAASHLLNYKELSEMMDLTWDEIDELFERAHVTWELRKAHV